MAKAWIITLQSKDQDKPPEVIEHVSARRKIGQIDDYLCDMYEQLFPGKVFLVHLKASISHPSGTQAILKAGDHILTASLSEVTA